MSPTSKNPHSLAHSGSQEIELSGFSLELDRSIDGRMYLPIYLYDGCYRGLLDSGATVSVLGGSGWKRLEKLRIPLLPSRFDAVRVANGSSCRVLGRIEVPVTIESRTRLCSFYVVPELNAELILGVDFWTLMGLLPNVTQASCSLAEIHAFSVDDQAFGHCAIGERQRDQLRNLVERFKPTLGSSRLGCTHLVEHHIDTRC